MTLTTVVRQVPLEWWVKGVAVPQPRPRACVTGRRTGGWHARVYNPSSADAWKRTVAEVSKEVFKKPFVGPVKLELRFRLPRPKRHFLKTGVLRGDAPESSMFDTRPDIDNLVKAVMDALTGICWKDDCQVARVDAEKRYTISCEGVSIRIVPYRDNIPFEELDRKGG